MDNIQKQVDELMSKMTLKEKIGQIIQIETHRLMQEPWNDEMGEEEWLRIENNLNHDALKKVLVDYNIGSIMSGGSAAPRSTVEGWVELIGTIKEYSLKTKLKIPIMYGLDAVHGFNFIYNGTVFPHNLAIAATWNPCIARVEAEVTAKQLAAVGVDLNYAPGLDVARDPRWGRTYETLGEDPYLAAQIAKSFVEGTQESSRVMACAKHYIAYSGSLNGKDRSPIDISERSLREIHLPPFKAAIEAGVEMVMLSSVEVNGVPVLVSNWLINDILRGELGFSGIITTDWGDVHKLYNYHKVCRTVEDAVVKTINNGIDIIMVPVDLKYFDIVEHNVENGRIPLDRIDEAVGRILKVKLKYNLFEKSPIDASQASNVIISDEARAAARMAAKESIVLLKNEEKLLPLSKDVDSILVVGEAASCRRHLCGGWTMLWQGASEEQITAGDTILDSIRSKVSKETKIQYFENHVEKEKIIEAAKVSKVCIFVAGEEPYAEWFGDSKDLRLPDEQVELLKIVRKTNIPIVTVLISGRPLLISQIEENTDSLLWSCLPGTEGGCAIADVIFGDYNPSGCLPISFPKDVSQLPCVYNSRINNVYDPMYPFGFGLSYTDFEYSNLTHPQRVYSNQEFEVGINVKNTGAMPGEVAVQLYVYREYASVTGPEKQLLRFDKIFLECGEEERVRFMISPENLAILNENMESVSESGIIRVQVGDKIGEIGIISVAKSREWLPLT